MQENPVWYKSMSSSCAKWQIWPLTLRKIIWYASTKSTKPWWQKRQRRKIVKYYVLNRPMTLFLPCIEMLSNAGFWPRNSSTCNQPKQTHLPNKLERRSKTGIISKNMIRIYFYEKNDEGGFRYLWKQKPKYSPNDDFMTFHGDGACRK